MATEEPILIDVEKVIAAKSPSLSKRIPKFIIRYLKKIVHQDEINDMLTQFGDTKGVEFAANVLKYLNVTYTPHNIDRLDPEGRYIFVSNHPLGGFDGMVLITIIGAIYPDVKFVVNDLLMFIKPLEPIFLPVNKFGKMSKNYADLINSSYSSNTQILNFPAGLCSRLIKGKITDLEWKPSFIKKATEYNRDIVPIYFSGRNSGFFYRLAKLRKFLGIKFNIEMMYLPNELFKQKNRNFDVYFGTPIPVETLTKDKTAVQWTEYIKSIVYYGAHNSTD